MTKLVILKFNGNFKSGFQVNLEIGEEGQFCELSCVGVLPPAKELSRCLDLWQEKYTRLDRDYRIKPQQIIYDGSIDPHKQLTTAAKTLKEKMQQWLNSPSFYSIDKQLREELNRSEAIRILICSNRPELYRLPWCCWDSIENYPNSEIAIGNLNYKRSSSKFRSKHSREVKILAILGDSKGINLDADCHFLKHLSDARVSFTIEPKPQLLYARLWQEPWDIVFFAGHSKTINRQGVLYLNQEDKLTIEDLKYGFRRAIDNGLQLAIFNSCDGLGIAEELNKLNLPQSIVMRLPIPDAIAREFIKYFLKAYAEGSSLYLATRKAREQLQAWEQQYPCASWLPTIYQNPTVNPPTWASLSGKNKIFTRFLDFDKRSQPAMLALLTGVCALILVLLIQSWGWLEAGELKTYDRLMSYRPSLPADERVLAITIDDRDLKYQRDLGMTSNMGRSLADEALDRLVNRLQLAGVKAIGSDVIHDFPFEPQLQQTIAKTDNFYGICRIAIARKNLLGIRAADSLRLDRVGFSNWAIDNDGGVRRQLVGMAGDKTCDTSVSLSLRLALEYLSDLPVEYEPQGTLKIGNTKFPRLKPNSGGYHLPEAQGYQILLNHRRALPKTLPLREALTITDNELQEQARDKIILIGVVEHNNDLHHTPYSQGREDRKLPGVIIHAQMASNLIDAVLGEQRLIWWLCDRVEISWIAFWCFVGSAIVTFNCKSLDKIFLGVLLSCLAIFSTSWLLFLFDGWLIAIAPVLGLLLAASLAVFVSR